MENIETELQRIEKEIAEYYARVPQVPETIGTL